MVSKCDNSLFIHTSSTSQLFILVYVDDIIVTGSSHSQVQKVIKDISTSFALKQLGQLDYFLGIEIKHLPNGSLLMTQSKYIKDLLDRAHTTSSKDVTAPMTSTCKLSNKGDDAYDDPTFYRSIVGALQYATFTRPDITYNVNKVCQFLSHPLNSHCAAVKRILRYLQGTTSYGLYMQQTSISAPLALTAFCDVDWTSDIDDRKSTCGACVFLDPNLITWWSKKQITISRSSTKVEYKSLALAAQELMWVESLLKEIKFIYMTPKIYCDNLSIVVMSHNPVLHHKTKHIELDLYFVRDKIQNKTLFVHHIPSSLQTADVLTKPLTIDKFTNFRQQLQVKDYNNLSNTVKNPQLQGYIRVWLSVVVILANRFYYQCNCKWERFGFFSLYWQSKPSDI
ncbi:PREDICTED: uncharacterized protein LOC109328071 [Lupinus angustifolius]|uniref:uncharacterized protein LOC109328071 n=1 Tax=Lupinus angustifolius TaxID=3871 RepID=UPI00092E5685|nr:PREDICTED: uncharacterized protein LOC109328071 [Lupinus angustifolius]